MKECESLSIQTAVESLAKSFRAKCHQSHCSASQQQSKPWWIVRGEQEALYQVAHFLEKMSQAHGSPRTLYRKLQEYLWCLETSMSDAVEEASGRSRRSHVEQWKAKGEAYTLARATRAITRLLSRWRRLDEQDVLEFRGQYLVELLVNENDTNYVNPSLALSTTVDSSEPGKDALVQDVLVNVLN